MHNFNDSLKKGKLGERWLFENWPHPGLEVLDGRKSDFIDIRTGKKLELKTDSYNMYNTPNFFIEMWSDVDKLKPGGPNQALLHGSDIWVYLFINNNTYFIFDTQKLVDYIKENSHKYTVVTVNNRSWTTTGYKVPREDVAHLYEEVQAYPLHASEKM